MPDTTTVGSLPYPEASDGPAGMTQVQALAEALQDRIIPSYLTEPDRDAEYGSPATLAATSRRGMTCYVHSRRSLCTFDSLAWRWMSVPRVLYQSFGITSTPGSTAIGASGNVFNTGSISLGGGGQRLVRVEFSGIGFTGGSFADIYGRIDFSGTNIGVIAGQTIPYHLEPAPVGATGASDVFLSASWTAKMTGAITVIALITKVLGDDRPYIKQASLTVTDLGPVD